MCKKNMIMKVCEQCGGEYEAHQSQDGRSRFCSRECMYKWKSENLRGENASGWKGGKIVKVCEQCGGYYEVRQYAKDTRRFCSYECDYKWRSENWHGENHPNWKGGKIVKTCEQCGGDYEVKPANKDRSRFCSRECHGKWMSGENHFNWKDGISSYPYCPKFNEAFKESIREKFNRTCFLCPTTEQEQMDAMRSQGKTPYKLSVHHVNYNKNCLCDDSDCEFVPLCLRCHGKIDHDREYWEQAIMDKLSS